MTKALISLTKAELVALLVVEQSQHLVAVKQAASLREQLSAARPVGYVPPKPRAAWVPKAPSAASLAFREALVNATRIARETGQSVVVSVEHA